jgi:dephospho-CoA kinase
LRGIRLRGMIESLDDAPVVIESYPGAAQDILCIPRKQRGLNLLREGLKELGLRGPGLLTNSHDEMDAITSALVARFFEAGQYEAMGIESEARLIVPTGSILTFDTLPVICITGKTGSGKSVVSRYLALYYGFKWVKTRDIILNLIIDDFEGISSQKLNLTKDDHITEVHLREFGRIIMEQHGQLPLRKRLLEELLRHTCPVVVDSIRSLEDVDPFNIKKRAIYTWYVSCPDSIIRDRWVGRKNSKGDYPLSYETIDRNADTIMQHADIILKNDGTLENLHRIIDDVLFSQIVEVTSDK